jgi:hypothetical protein
MFTEKQTKYISTIIRSRYRSIKSALYNVFETSIIGCSREVDYLQNITTNIGNFINNLNIP